MTGVGAGVKLAETPTVWDDVRLGVDDAVLDGVCEDERVGVPVAVGVGYCATMLLALMPHETLADEPGTSAMAVNTGANTETEATLPSFSALASAASCIVAWVTTSCCIKDSKLRDETPLFISVTKPNVLPSIGTMLLTGTDALSIAFIKPRGGGSMIITNEMFTDKMCCSPCNCRPANAALPPFGLPHCGSSLRASAPPHRSASATIEYPPSLSRTS